ncbi:MAG: glycosyltransferase family 2 protein [Bacteroidia bacterium]|nr:glycosyltransferase family 2 protein [Bacteroidia bacterium]
MDSELRQQVDISVLMPVYNAERTLLPAMWSVLNQSYENFEFLIYLDGATDNSERIINQFSDPRIKVFSSTENKGIVFARNELIKHAAGGYLAWLDADDIWLPGKLAAQKEYLDVHPEIKILATYVQVRNHQQISEVRWPVKPAILDAWLFFRNPLVQSSIMFRSNLKGPTYEQKFEYLEDYKFYSNLLGKKSIAIYPQVLCSYYEDTEKQRIDKYIKYDFVGKLEQIMRTNFSILGIQTGKNEIALVREFLRGKAILKEESATIVYHFLHKVESQNRKLKVFETSSLKSIILWQKLRLAKVSPDLRLKILGGFLAKPWLFMAAKKARVLYK